MKIEEHTYGNTRAALVLAKLLNTYEDKKTIRRVGSLFYDLSLYLKALEKIENPKIKRVLITLVREEFLTRCDRIHFKCDDIMRHFVNVVMMKCREGGLRLKPRATKQDCVVRDLNGRVIDVLEGCKS